MRDAALEPLGLRPGQDHGVGPGADPQGPVADGPVADGPAADGPVADGPGDYDPYLTATTQAHSPLVKKCDNQVP
jgi:hypothetical protein